MNVLVDAGTGSGSLTGLRCTGLACKQSDLSVIANTIELHCVADTANARN